MYFFAVTSYLIIFRHDKLKWQFISITNLISVRFDRFVHVCVVDVEFHSSSPCASSCDCDNFYDPSS